MDKGRGRRRDSVKNTDLSSSIDSKAHKYGSLPRFCLWPASIILAVWLHNGRRSSGFERLKGKKERKRRENGRTTLTPLPKYSCLGRFSSLLSIDTLSCCTRGLFLHVEQDYSAKSANNGLVKRLRIRVNAFQVEC